MTFTPEKDLAEHIRFIAEYEDGSKDVFAIPQGTLDQGPGVMGVARIIAGEWQRDGYLKPGKIIGVRRPSIDEMVEMYGRGNK